MALKNYYYYYNDENERIVITVEELNVTQNGTYTAPNGKAYSPVVVNVDGGTGLFQNKDVTYTVNNTYRVIPDDGYDGLSFVDITVDIPTLPNANERKY